MSANVFPNFIDSDVFNLIEQESQRQKFGLEMIASENYTSPQVMKAQGSILDQIDL